MSIDQEDILGQENEFEDEDVPSASKNKANKNVQLMTYGAYAVAVFVVGFAMFKIFGPRFLPSDDQGYSAAPISIDQPVGHGAEQYGYQGQGYQPQPQNAAQVSVPTGHYQEAQNYPANPQMQDPVSVKSAAPVLSAPQPSVPAVEPVVHVQPQVMMEPQAGAVAPQASDQDSASIVQVQNQLDQQDIQLKAIQETLDEIKKSLSTNAAKPAPKASAAVKPRTSQPASQNKPQQQAQRPAQKNQGGSGQQKNSPASISLKAVLDGRAWFVTKSGESISVSVGDTIPGVGPVQRIDPDQGQVIMSNGVVYR